MRCGTVTRTSATARRGTPRLCRPTLSAYVEAPLASPSRGFSLGACFGCICVQDARAVDQGSAGVKVDGYTKRFCDLFFSSSSFDGRIGVYGNASVAAGGNRNREGNQLAR